MTDADVRRAIYDLTIRNGSTPAIGGVAAELRASETEVRDAFRRLAAQRILVLDADDILMAAPFSGVPTSFVVRANGISYYANCIWDALGVSPMLKADSTIETTCPDCAMPMELAVRGDEVRGEGIVHFAVPAREWWNDIVFT
jgi:hypothetical protein